MLLNRFDERFDLDMIVMIVVVLVETFSSHVIRRVQIDECATGQPGENPGYEFGGVVPIQRDAMAKPSDLFDSKN